MPRTASKATVNNFVGGLVSDYHELNQPPNTTVDENNCDLDRKGSRKRRLGMDFEAGYAGSTQAWDATATWPTMYSKTYQWNAVNEDGNVNFKIVQGGNFLTFYDMNFSTLSQGLLPFVINLDTYRAPSYYSTSPYGIQVASGKGALFVVGEAITPFYVQYDPVANAITVVPISIKQRDFQLQDTTTPFDAKLQSLTPQLQYDLYNQGWSVSASCDSTKTPNVGIRPVLGWYNQITGLYPPKNKSWWLGKILNPSRGIENFQPENFDEVYVGNMLAPMGTYILDAFNKDRSGASGVSGLPIELETSRPTAVAFNAGRVFYGFKNKIFFSQVLDDDFSKAGRCYQEADPTSEKISDLVATDGGVLQIIDSSDILALYTYQNAVFAFSYYGVWAIGGSSVGGGFAATDYSVYKVSETGILTPRTLISVEGVPTWWSRLGIFALVSDPTKQGYSAQNILDGKLQLFYNDIPALSKKNATGSYDFTKKCVTWLYNSTGSSIGGNPYVGDTLLNYDTLLKAFYKYTIQQVTNPSYSSPYVTDVFNVFDIVFSTTAENVVNGAGAIVTAVDTTNVTIEVGSLVSSGSTLSSLKYLTFSQGIV